MNPIESVILRFFLSALVMIPALILFHRKAHLKFRDRKLCQHLSMMVLTSGIGYHIFFFWALEYTTPTNTALIIALNPFFTAFGEIIVFKKARPARFYIGFMLAFAGALWVIISRGGTLSVLSLGRGELFSLIAALLWAVYSICARITNQDSWDFLWLNAYNYLFTALLLVPFVSLGFYTSTLHALTPSSWYSMIYMAVFPTVIGYTIYYVGIQRKGPAWAATFIYLVPSFTAFLDHLYFDALLTLPLIVGTILVVSGLVFGNITQNHLLWLKNKIRFTYNM